MPKQALLIYPPQHCLAQAMRIWSFDYATHFPLGLLRLSTWLKARGYKVDYLDAFNVHQNTEAGFKEAFSASRLIREAPWGSQYPEPRTQPVYHVGLTDEAIRRWLTRLGKAPDEVYISAIFTWSWQPVHRCVALVREIFPAARIKLGGVYPILCPDHARASGAHEIIDRPMPELEDQWLDPQLLSSRARIDGVALKTSVGCPNRCSYCAVHKLEGQRLRYRDPVDAADEMESLYTRLGVSKYYFWESNILMGARRHLLALLDELHRRNLSFSLQAPEGFQPNLLTGEIVQALKASGFGQISLTLETADPVRGLETGRPTGLSDVKQAVALLKRHGYRTRDIRVVLLIGQPNQTLDQVLRDVIRVFALGACVSFLVYTPIPGTRDFTTHGHLFCGKPLEDLDAFLYPLAGPELDVAQIGRLIQYFNFRYFPVRRIADSDTKDPLILRMGELIRSEAAQGAA